MRCLSRSAWLKPFSACTIKLSLKSSCYTPGRCLDSCVTSSVQDASSEDDKGTQPLLWRELGDDSELWHRVNGAAPGKPASKEPGHRRAAAMLDGGNTCRRK